MGFGTPLLVNQTPGGLFSVLSLMETPGSSFYVHSGTGTDATGYGTSPNAPCATLDYAVALCTAAKGDVIFVLPGHAETTTAIALDVSGITVIGLGRGRNRPAITATTAASDLVSVSAANVTLRNLRLIGAASGNTALLNLAAADFAAFDCSFEPGATPLMSVTAAAGSARARFENCIWKTSANGPDCAIDIETSDSDGWVVKNCIFDAAGFGWDLGVIRASVDAAVGWVIDSCTFVSCDTVAIDFNSSAGASGVDGVVQWCSFLATAALTSIEDIIDTGRYQFIECYAHDATNFTTAGARVPIGTVS